jgi:hypothetical protein
MAAYRILEREPEENSEFGAEAPASGPPRESAY